MMNLASFIFLFIQFFNYSVKSNTIKYISDYKNNNMNEKIKKKFTVGDTPKRTVNREP